MGFFIIVLTAHAQTVSVIIGSPASGGIANENVNVRAFVSSTYEIQSFQASVEGRTMDLFFDSGDPHEGWTNSIPLTGLTYGNKTLTVTATDGFGNSNQVQRSFVYDLRPTLNVTDPADGTVARPGGLIFSASAADDAPTGPTIRVNSAPYPPMLLATGTKTLNTNLFLADGQCLDVDFEASDSANQTTGAPRRRIYTQLSSNLVEIARVSRGQIQDVQPDRILFLFTEQAWGTSTRFPKLLIQSRTNGIETLVFQRTNMDVGPAFLAPQGTVLVASGSPFAGYTTGYGL